MAKKAKPGQSDKTFPRVKQTWEDSSDPENIFDVLVQSRDLDETKKEFWNCLKFEADDEKSVAIVLYLKDFTKPGMQCIADPDVPEKIEAPEPGEPEIMVLPIKNGFTFKCSSPACGDTHDVENAMPFNEVTAEHDRFKERHRAHLSVGRLGAAAE